jgi:sporulation protein, YlmC/YmxH family
MKLSDLQDKDVVNINDGKKIGNIIDISIDQKGNMEGIMVEQYKFLVSFFTNNIIEIKWTQIEKIGKDVILVNLK